MAEQVLNVTGLAARVEDKQLLHGVDLTINKGETHVLMGPNGAGKSTLGYVLMGAPKYTVTGGQILFKGEDISAQKLPISKYRQSIGMVFQHFNVFPNLTVLENVTLAPVLEKKVPKDQAKEEAMALLRRGFCIHPLK